MIDERLVQLTLAYPRAAERQLLEELLELERENGGFTTLAAEGHGQGFHHATLPEQVRGRAERGLVLSVLPESQARALLQALGQRLPSREIAYWLVPVAEFGRIAG